MIDHIDRIEVIDYWVYQQEMIINQFRDQIDMIQIDMIEIDKIEIDMIEIK
jgi:hypothetical protein